MNFFWQRTYKLKFVDIFFIILSLFGGLFYGLAFDGYDFFCDDLSYGQVAYQLSQGNFNIPPDGLAQRLGAILPIAWFYVLGGVNDFTFTLFPFLSYWLILYLIYRVFAKENSWIAVFAMLFYGLDFYSLFFNHKPYPDLPLATVAWAMVLGLYFRQNNLVSGAGLAWLCMYGFLVKETIIYFIPGFIFWLIYDLIQKRKGLFWLYFSGSGIVFLGVYLILNAYFTGNFLFRIQAIQASHYPSDASYFDKNWQFMVGRLTYEPLLMLINAGFMICILPSLPSFLKLFKAKFWVAEDWEFFLAVIITSVLAMFWFSSTSLQYYNPLNLQGRMILMLVPVASVLSAINLVRACQRPSYFSFLSVGFAFCGGVLYYFYASKLAFIYGLLSCFLGVYAYLISQKNTHNSLIINKLYIWSFKDQNELNKRILAIVWLLILLIHPIYTMLKPSETNYKAEKFIFKQHFNQTSKKAIVFADVVTLHTLTFNFPYQPAKNYRFVAYEELKKDWNKELLQYVIINPAKIKFSYNYNYPIPPQVLNPPLHWQLVIQVGEVKIYQIK
jgi:hypothetical protein